MKRWTLRARLVAAALGASAIIAGVGIAATASNARIAEAMGTMQERRVAPLVRLDALGRSLERQRAAVLATLAATNDVMVEALEARIARDARQIPAALRELRGAAATD